MWAASATTPLCSLVLVATLWQLVTLPAEGQFQWQHQDAFDQIRGKLDSVTGRNCKSVDVNRLFLSPNTVTHVPNLQWIGIDPVFANRSNLLHVHNMALSRAFFLR